MLIKTINNHEVPDWLWISHNEIKCADNMLLGERKTKGDKGKIYKYNYFVNGVKVGITKYLQQHFKDKINQGSIQSLFIKSNGEPVQYMGKTISRELR